MVVSRMKSYITWIGDTDALWIVDIWAWQTRL